MEGESFKSKIGNIIESGKNRIETTKKDIGSIAEKAIESGKNAIGNAAKKVKPLVKETAKKVKPIVGYAKKVSHEINAPALEALLSADELALDLLEGNNMTPKSNNTNNTNNSYTPKNMDKKKEENRGSGILGALTRIAGKAYDNANAAVGNSTDLYGLAKDLTGYTNAEIKNKKIDMQYQKEFENYMAGLDVQKQRNITKAMADLYATDPNSKAYMDKQFELQKELQREGFNQGLISQILGGAINLGGLALFGKSISDSRTKLKYCLDK